MSLKKEAEETIADYIIQAEKAVTVAGAQVTTPPDQIPSTRTPRVLGNNHQSAAAATRPE